MYAGVVLAKVSLCGEVIRLTGNIFGKSVEQFCLHTCRRSTTVGFDDDLFRVG